MGIQTKTHNDETHYTSLYNYVNRGNLYAALSNDGQCIYVNGDTPVGYPTGYSVLCIKKPHAKELIAVLSAALQLKE